jgi:hypothetical protein
MLAESGKSDSSFGSAQSIENAVYDDDDIVFNGLNHFGSAVDDCVKEGFIVVTVYVAFQLILRQFQHCVFIFVFL